MPNARDRDSATRPDCRVYWGSHGCKLERGHDGPHLCSCADDAAADIALGVLNVGAPPYYGPETRFYGEDAPDAHQVNDAD